MAEPADPVEAAWDQVLSNWERPESHRKFIALCSSLGRLKDAGTRYREVRETTEDADKAAEAKKQIDLLLTSAMQSLEVIRTPPKNRSRLPLLVVGALLAISLIIAAAWAAMRMS